MRLVTEPYSLRQNIALVIAVICVLKVFSCNIVITNIIIHDFAVILLW